MGGRRQSREGRRVEWIYIPDSATAAAAINAGEVDWWEQAADQKGKDNDDRLPQSP